MNILTGIGIKCVCVCIGEKGKIVFCHLLTQDGILTKGFLPREGNGNPLLYSCLENSMDRGTWRAHGILKSWSWDPKELATTEHICTYCDLKQLFPFCIPYRKVWDFQFFHILSNMFSLFKLLMFLISVQLGHGILKSWPRLSTFAHIVI